MNIYYILAFIIFASIVIIAVGLSCLSQAISPLDFNNAWDQEAYYKNPLIKIGSKYFHWRPKGSVVLTKSLWKKIETDFSIKLKKARVEGILAGRSAVIKEIEERLQEKQDSVEFPTDPYDVLGLEVNDKTEIVESAYQKLMDLYASENFTNYDTAFEDLASIRRKQIRRAYNLIMAGVVTKDISKGEF